MTDDQTMLGHIYATPAALDAAVATIPGAAAAVASALPAPVRHVHIVGSGTSHHAATAAAGAWRDALGAVATVTVGTPFEFCHYLNPRRLPAPTLLVAVSQSGRSTATVAALRAATAAGLATVLVTGDPAAPAAAAAGAVLDIRAGEEDVGAKTKGYVCTVLALVLLARAVGRVGPVPGLALLPELARATLRRAAAHLVDMTERCDGAAGVTLLSYGPNVATAREAALKIVETTLLPAEGQELEEYLHGPQRRLARDSGIVAVAPSGPGLERALAFLRYARSVTPHTLLVTEDGVAGEETAATVVRVPAAPAPYLSPLLTIVPLQLLAQRLTAAQGRSTEEIIHPDLVTLLDTKIDSPLT